ncbi:translation initiation factor IF-2-like [Cervus elaphus]|uniref:translation initiation factor IF-2-like n=1 Tax=Cervus elaphus TaxID=9860 RepID=UPI001CC2D176|nr:translation initiation factor IF-2-like [Cervus elaphus]
MRWCPGLRRKDTAAAAPPPAPAAAPPPELAAAPPPAPAAAPAPAAPRGPGPRRAPRPRPPARAAPNSLEVGCGALGSAPPALPAQRTREREARQSPRRMREPRGPPLRLRVAKGRAAVFHPPTPAPRQRWYGSGLRPVKAPPGAARGWGTQPPLACRGIAGGCVPVSSRTRPGWGGVRMGLASGSRSPPASSPEERLVFLGAASERSREPKRSRRKEPWSWDGVGPVPLQPLPGVSVFPSEPTLGPPPGLIIELPCTRHVPGTALQSLHTFTFVSPRG